MAIYNKLQLQNNDDFPTPLDIWEHLKDFIPLDKKIWCPFYCNGKLSITEITENIIHKDRDFFEWEPEKWDLIIDNPPFRPMPKVLNRLFELDKPFLILMPIQKLRTKYSRKFLKDKDNITIIFPSYRFNYLDNKSSAGFETIALGYKIDDRKCIWL